MTPAETDGCNGFTNYETWLTALHIGNTQEYYYRVRGVLEELKKKGADRDTITEAVEGAIRDLVAEIIEDGREGLPSYLTDYLNHLAGSINYSEIARDSFEDEIGGPE